MSPMAALCCQDRKKALNRPMAVHVNKTWPPPIPNMGVRICQSRDGLSSSPTKKSIITTPNSVKCITASILSMRDRPNGPMTIPAIR